MAQKKRRPVHARRAPSALKLPASCVGAKTEGHMMTKVGNIQKTSPFDSFEPSQRMKSPDTHFTLAFGEAPNNPPNNNNATTENLEVSSIVLL